MINERTLRSPWSSAISKGSAEGHHGEQEDPHAGAEVAAVDRDDEDADEETPSSRAVRVVDVGETFGDRAAPTRTAGCPNR